MFADVEADLYLMADGDGTYAAGSLGQRMQKRYILSAIYLARAIAISIFLWAPLSPASVYVF
eukprot:gene48511-65072_t